MKPTRNGTLFTLGILTALFAQAASACDSRQISLQQRTDAVIDAATGTVLYAQNENAYFFPASMTKRMTLLLTLRALRDGVLMPDQRIALSNVPYNNGRGGVEKGDAIPFMFHEISVWDAIVAMNTASSNRAPQALARKIAGSEKAFADMMNAEAGRMKISAHFENPAGYPTSARVERVHQMTAIAHVRIVKQLFQEFPDEMARLRLAGADLTGFTQSGRAVGFHIGTTNKFLKAGIYNDPHVEGGKTGTACASGAAMDAVWRVNGRLVIGVTSGHRTGAGRYDALSVHMRKPDEIFLAKLEESRTQELVMAFTQAFSNNQPSRLSITGPITFSVAQNSYLPEQTIRAVPKPPEDTPPMPDYPNPPPAIMPRFDLAENHLRSLRF